MVFKRKNTETLIVPVFSVASPARFERAAFRLGGERSILLSYGDKKREARSVSRVLF